jgi:hypothetical protein
MAPVLRSCRLSVLALVIALAGHAGAQTIPANAAPPGPRTGMILGQVVDAVTGGPIPETIVTGLVMGTVVDARDQQPVDLALVTLGGPQGRKAVLTDAKGRFVFLDLPAGPYSIQAVRAGYSDGAYGRRRPGGSEQILTLGIDEHIQNVAITLWNDAAISGSVSDEAGEPVVDLPVRVLRKTIVAGVNRWTAAGAARTDDRGFYRVSSLDPGSYAVLVAPAPTATPSGGMAYRNQYYANGRTPADADVISLEPGDERRAVDLQIMPAAVYRVTGTITGPDGPLSADLSLWPEPGSGSTATSLAAATTASSPSGRFAFSGVPAGRYVIRVLKAPPLPAGRPRVAVGPPAPTLVGQLPVTVESADITDISIDLQEGFRISGRLEFAGAQAAPQGNAIGQIRFVLEAANGASVAPPALAIGQFSEDRSFTSNQLPPDRYYLRVTGLSAGWTLKTAMVDGRDVSDVPLLLDRDVTGAVITLSSRATELNGKVVDASGKPDADASVLIFPADETRWTDYGSHPRRIQAIRVSRDGTYRMAGLPPGDYRVIAVDDEQTADWPNAQLLKLLSVSATPVHLADDETRSVLLTILAVPQR